MAPTAAETKAKLSKIPALTFEVLTEPEDKRDGLKLVADSVAQQRQIASRSLIFNPICLGVLALVLSIAHYVTTSFSGRDDWGVLITTYGGTVLGYLLTVRYFTGSYIHLAEETKWSQWLRGPGEIDDLVLGARFGADIIGALVLRLEPPHADSHSLRNKATIRAWTVKNKYRGKGLGGDLLREALFVAQSTLGCHPSEMEVVFSENHANSANFLIPFFNGVFADRDQRADRALRQALAQQVAK